jgi:Holliday junction resolvase RusA-like endonuclease
MKIELTFVGRPITKKNHTERTGQGKQIQSKACRQYAADCIWQIPHTARLHIDTPVNVKCVYYMTINYANCKAKVDLVGLLQGTDDILVDGGVLADDNCRIVAGHDGSRVLWDKERPRVEITIESMEGEQ